MQIIDLSEEYHPLFFKCLEDWSHEMAEAGEHRACWYRKFKDKGLRAKLALDDNGVVGGMIQYIPADQAPIEGKGLYFVLCIWVHGYHKGRGNFQKKGMGKALLRAAEQDTLALGAKGLAVWGVSMPFWMKASWFKKQGFKVVDKNGMAVLLWKAYSPDAVAPSWIKPKKTPEPASGKVTLTAFINGWCAAQNINYERARLACREMGDEVAFVTVDTSDRETFLEWGISDAVFLDGKEITKGPPLKYEKVKKLLAKRLRKLRRR